MIQRIRAVFRDGAFQPASACDVPEDCEVDLVVTESPGHSVPSMAEDERRRVLREVTARMRDNPIPADAPRFSREQLHERG